MKRVLVLALIAMLLLPTAAFAGSVPHHHMLGNVRCRGQISFNVSPSYSRPFFITYRTVLVLWMSSSGFASSTMRSASFPGSSEPKSCWEGLRSWRQCC